MDADMERITGPIMERHVERIVREASTSMERSRRERPDPSTGWRR